MLKVWEKHKYTAITFVAFTALWLAGDGWMTGEEFVTHGSFNNTLYFTDITIGFVSRTFIATLLKFLTGDRVTLSAVTAFINANALLAIFLFSVIIGRVLKKCENDKFACMLASFLVFSGTSLNQIIGNNWTFTFDHYWLICMFLSILLVKNKFLRWAIPLLTFIGIWINCAYTLACFPLVFLFVLYELYENKPQRKSLSVFAVVLAVTTVASTIYFVLFVSDMILMSAEQMHKYVLSRMPDVFSTDFYAADGYFYGLKDGVSQLSEFKNLSKLGFFGAVKLVAVYGKLFGFGISSTEVIVYIPLLLIFEAFWIYLFIVCKDRLFRFVLIFNISYPLVVYISVIASTDDARFLSFGLITQLMSLLWLCAAKNPHVMKATEKATAFFEKHRVPLVLILVFALVSTRIPNYVSAMNLIKLWSLLPLALLLIWQKRLVAVCAFVVCAAFNLDYAFIVGIPFMFMLLIDAMATDENGLYVRELSIKKKDISSAANKKHSEKKKIDELKVQKTILITLLLAAFGVICFIREFILSTAGDPEFTLQYWLDIARAAIPLSAFGVIAAVSLNKKGVQKGLCTITGAVTAITAVAIILYNIFRYYHFAYQNMIALASVFCFAVLIYLPYKQNAKALAAVSELEDTKGPELYSLASFAFMLALS